MCWILHIGSPNAIIAPALLSLTHLVVALPVVLQLRLLSGERGVLLRSLRSSDVFVKMRDLDDEDLRLIAGYILVAPKVQGIQWGGGKIYF